MRSEDIEIPEPCHADWDAMRPEERGKFCFECNKKVHDLSSMTKDEARGLLRRAACEDLCISFEHEEDGSLVFLAPAPKPAPLVPLSRLRRPRTATAAVAGVGMAVALAACTPHGDGSAPTREVEHSVFQFEPVVIPHGEAGEATPTRPLTRIVIDDEPCEPKTPVAEPVKRVRKGRVRRTAGRPRRPRVKGGI